MRYSRPGKETQLSGEGFITLFVFVYWAVGEAYLVGGGGEVNIESERGERREAENVYYPPWSLPAPPFLHSPPPDTTSRPKHCHLHKVLKRELTEQGRWYRPTDTEEGGPRADTESYYTPTDWHTHTHTCDSCIQTSTEEDTSLGRGTIKTQNSLLAS